MKTSLIEIGLPTSKLVNIQPALEQCLLETGDALIGHQVYDDLTFLVVRLLNDTLQLHLATLSAAFREDMIDSFQVVNCQLFKVIFKQEKAKISLREFPLRAGESWFTAAGEEKAAYLCLISPYLSQQQIAWLSAQTVIAQWAQAS